MRLEDDKSYYDRFLRIKSIAESNDYQNVVELLNGTDELFKELKETQENHNTLVLQLNNFKTRTSNEFNKAFPDEGYGGAIFTSNNPYKYLNAKQQLDYSNFKSQVENSSKKIYELDQQIKARVEEARISLAQQGSLLIDPYKVSKQIITDIKKNILDDEYESIMAYYIKTRDENPYQLTDEIKEIYQEIINQEKEFDNISHNLNYKIEKSQKASLDLELAIRDNKINSLINNQSSLTQTKDANKQLEQLLNNEIIKLKNLAYKMKNIAKNDLEPRIKFAFDGDIITEVKYTIDLVNEFISEYEDFELYNNDKKLSDYCNSLNNLTQKDPHNTDKIKELLEELIQEFILIKKTRQNPLINKNRITEIINQANNLLKDSQEFKEQIISKNNIYKEENNILYKDFYEFYIDDIYKINIFINSVNNILTIWEKYNNKEDVYYKNFLNTQYNNFEYAVNNLSNALTKAQEKLDYFITKFESEE